jgi:alpha-ketoglutarate-dependent taurine dioxygenase
MEKQDIFEEWGTVVHTTYDELISCDYDSIRKLLLERNLFVIKGIDADLSDKSLFLLGQVFGKVWDREDYSKPYIVKGLDSTNPYQDTMFPVSYFRSGNNMFGSTKMDYHADMPHVNENSYPGRVLYMANNTADGSGLTSWLNLELGWALFSEEEKAMFDGYEVVLHDMYSPGLRIETVPFLKTNPKTGKKSPTVNCIHKDNVSSGWIRDILLNGESIGFSKTVELHRTIYSMLESKKNTLYTHKWQNGDIVVYDNWFNVHMRSKVNDNSVTGGRLLKRLTFNFI